MTTWWSDNHDRLALEREKIEELQASTSWLKNVEWGLDDLVRMRVVFDIKLEHATFNLKLTYHTTFPFSAPSVAPVDSSHLSQHQYAGGDLCLEIRPDNWRSEFTGADMINSAYNLLVAEQPNEEGVVTTAPSAHNVTESMKTRFKVNRFCVSNEQLEFLQDQAPKYATGKLCLVWSGEGYVVAHLAALENGEWAWANKSLPAALKKEASTPDVTFVRSEQKAAAFGGVAKYDDLVGVLTADISLDSESFHCLILTADGCAILFRQIADVEGIIRYRTIALPEESFRRSGVELNELGDRRVGIVGLGSLGSKVATVLARAGVRKFELVDDDIFHPGNIERHDADWRDVGIHKVDVARRRLQLIAPDVEVGGRKVAIGAQVSTSEAGNVNGALASCDLLIDATANADVFSHLTSIALSADKSLIWGGVYAGGIGAYMARSRAKVDPEPLTIRQALNEFYETIEEKPPTPESEGYDGSSDDGFLIASDADVTLLAGHISNYAIDSLLNVEPSSFSDSIYLIGFKRAWIFAAPFHVQPVSVNASPRSTTVVATHTLEQTEFVGDLLKKKMDEIKSRQDDH